MSSSNEALRGKLDKSSYPGLKSQLEDHITKQHPSMAAIVLNGLTKTIVNPKDRAEHNKDVVGFLGFLVECLTISARVDLEEDPEYGESKRKADVTMFWKCYLKHLAETDELVSVKRASSLFLRIANLKQKQGTPAVIHYSEYLKLLENTKAYGKELREVVKCMLYINSLDQSQNASFFDTHRELVKAITMEYEDLLYVDSKSTNGVGKVVDLENDEDDQEEDETPTAPTLVTGVPRSTVKLVELRKFVENHCTRSVQLKSGDAAGQDTPVKEATVMAITTKRSKVHEDSAGSWNNNSGKSGQGSQSAPWRTMNNREGPTDGDRGSNRRTRGNREMYKMFREWTNQQPSPMYQQSPMQQQQGQNFQYQQVPFQQQQQLNYQHYPNQQQQQQPQYKHYSNPPQQQQQQPQYQQGGNSSQMRPPQHPYGKNKQHAMLTIQDTTQQDNGEEVEDDSQE